MWTISDVLAQGFATASMMFVMRAGDVDLDRSNGHGHSVVVMGSQRSVALVVVS